MSADVQLSSAKSTTLLRMPKIAAVLRCPPWSAEGTWERSMARSGDNSKVLSGLGIRMKLPGVLLGYATVKSVLALQPAEKALSRSGRAELPGAATCSAPALALN